MLTPKEIVESLDKYIIGQDDAKHAVAIALRNRYRRNKLSEEMRNEITPKNIIMIGPTGVGKTEIARRLAKLVDAPFVKVEATKFTEVGYVGRDVESMIRDLVDASIRICKNAKMETVKQSAEVAVEQQLADILCGKKKKKKPSNPLQLLLTSAKDSEEKTQAPEEEAQFLNDRAKVLDELRNGQREDDLVEVDVEEKNFGNDTMIAAGFDMNLGEMFGGIIPPRIKSRKLPVKEARRILIQQECEKRIDMDDIIREAVNKAEQDGILFIDEIDKIASSSNHSGPDVSREGVQRDILPIVEGSVVSTKYGPIKTDYMLFIAAGAFHETKVTDLIPELQGRFPIRVNLNDLSIEDFKAILTQPENAITKQYASLLSVDNVNLSFTDSALNEIARYAHISNENMENIGARRLHTVMETLLDEISFNANGNHPMIDLEIDDKYVDSHLSKLDKNEDIHKYIL